MAERATLEETLEFCQKVREAGGGTPLHALIPAVPTDESQCLIAKNLNFNCKVFGVGGNGKWAMWFDPEDIEIRNAISEKLSLIPVERKTVEDLPQVSEVGVVLPDNIGRVAHDFDNVDSQLYELDLWLSETPEDDIPYFSPESALLMKEMIPYVQYASEEAIALARKITDDGKIVI